jgi:iron complex outermembrane receptor protein
MLFTSLAFAQQTTIKGKITDGETGGPLVGVTIVVKGTTVGTTSDFDGNYQLTAEKGATIAFSFIGYKKEEVLVTNQTVINVTMLAEYENLGEMIVIGYGVQKKTDKTGAVSHITAEEMSGGVITDPLQAIQGKSSGVMITKKGGDPNSGFSVKIRGASGFDSNTQPLYVIDGIPGADPTTVAPEDIETFNVLKDASSAAIYGSRGSNGVILITTKKGSKNSGNVNFNVKFSVDEVANKLDLLTANDLRTFAADNKLKFDDGGDSVDWQDQIYRRGFTQSYNLSFSGGNNTSTYYASLTQANWMGVMKGTEKDRTIAKINLTHEALGGRLLLSGSMSATFEQNDYENYGGFNKDDIIYQALSRNPTDPVKNADGSYYKVSREFNYENPLAVIDNVQNLRDAKRFMANLKADLKIFEGLMGSVNVGYIRDDSESSYFRPKGIYATADNGFARKGYNNAAQKLIDATLNYKKQLADVHNIDVMAGYSWQEYVYNSFYAQGENPQSSVIGYNSLDALLDITRNAIGSNKGMWRLTGFFGRAQYNFDSRYYVSGSLRRDGSSKFGENNKWGWFPTVATGWNIDQESFMDNAEWLDQLKLRVSYGVSGNQEIGEYRSLALFQPSGTATNPETGQQVVTFSPAWNANPDLRWEQTGELNVGVDFAILNTRLSGSVEVYSKQTKDLLGSYAVPVPPNLAPTTFANSGSLENKGVELSLQYYAVETKNFKWKTNFVASYNKQLIIDLGAYAPIDGVRKEGYITGRGLIGDQNYITGIMVGQEMGAFYLPIYADSIDKKGKMLFYTDEEGVLTNEISKAKREILGSPLPDFEFGWSNSFTMYDNWFFDFSLRSMIGNDVFNATRMFFDYPGNIPNLNGVASAKDWYALKRKSGPTVCDLYVEDASFLRLDYLSLGYNVDTKKLGWNGSLKVYVAANNLYTLTKYTGVDPETSVDGVSFGIDQYNVYPKTQSFSFGINATF